MIPRIETGIPGLDHITMGGFPEGRTVVVVGSAGSAKTVLAGQFLAVGAASGQPGVFVTFEEGADDLRRNLSSLGLDIAAWEAAGDWAFVDGSSRYDARTDEIVPVNIDTLLAQIGQAVDHTSASRIVIDSHVAAGLDHDDGMWRRRLHGLLVELRRMRVTVVMTVEADLDADTVAGTPGVEQYVGDTVVLLRNSRQGESRRRTVEVLKMRGAEHRRGQFPFSVHTGEGIIVLPLVVDDLSQGSTDTRVSSGSHDVDVLCGGGFFRDSIVLVSGPTGTGKTLLVTEFLAGGIAGGEKSLMLAFEESRDQLRRNARGWGYDFDDAERSGLLKVVAVYPESNTLEDHLIEIRRVVDEFGPARIAIDSLSALERVGSGSAYREFLIGLTSFVKARQTVGLFTSTTDTLIGGTSVTETNLLTLTDSIILLRYVEVLGEVKRGLSVLKMRGSDHDHNIREYRIDSSGLHVGDPFSSVAGILSGNVVNLVPHENPLDDVLPPSFR